MGAGEAMSAARCVVLYVRHGPGVGEGLIGRAIEPERGGETHVGVKDGGLGRETQSDEEAKWFHWTMPRVSWMDQRETKSSGE